MPRRIGTETLRVAMGDGDRMLSTGAITTS